MKCPEAVPGFWIARFQFDSAFELFMGTQSVTLFGVHRERPWVRFDCMGLVAVLDGGRVVALSNDEAVIEKPSGARLTFHRRAMVPDETCLIWD